MIAQFRHFFSLLPWSTQALGKYKNIHLKKSQQKICFNQIIYLHQQNASRQFQKRVPESDVNHRPPLLRKQKRKCFFCVKISVGN
jgi:hypothetical protein